MSHLEHETPPNNSVVGELANGSFVGLPFEKPGFG
jgi:hypothetical protein